MKNQRLLVALTVVNLGLLTFQLVRPRLARPRKPGRCSAAAPWSSSTSGARSGRS